MIMSPLKLVFIFMIFTFILTTCNCSCSCSQLEDFIVWAEGRNGCMYRDTGGIRHVGIGFNLDRAGARDTFNQHGINYDLTLNGGYCLSSAQMTSLFNSDIQWARDGARRCVSSFDSQPHCVQNVLIDMTYNMGGTSLCKWSNFVKQINGRLYDTAARNMASTKYCSQVGRRCTRNQEILRSCSAYI